MNENKTNDHEEKNLNTKNDSSLCMATSRQTNQCACVPMGLCLASLLLLYTVCIVMS